jgi:hypothetical protein
MYAKYQPGDKKADSFCGTVSNTFDPPIGFRVSPSEGGIRSKGGGVESLLLSAMLEPEAETAMFTSLNRIEGLFD